MLQILNISNYLEVSRKLSQQNQTKGPRTLICGNHFSGKSTLCKTLINYACRLRNEPVFADLDIEFNEVGSLPATLGLAVCTDSYPRRSRVPNPSFLEVDNKIVLFHSYSEYSQNNLFHQQIQALARILESKIANAIHHFTTTHQSNQSFLNQSFLQKSSFSSGVIINGP